MKLILTLQFIVLSVLSLANVSRIDLVVSIIDEETLCPLNDSYIEITQNGVLINTVKLPSDSNKVLVSFPVGFYYQVYLIKEGYVTKMVLFDATHNNTNELAPVITQKMEIALFKLIPNIDFSFLEAQPLAKFKLSEQGPFFDMDKNYTRQIVDKIKKLRGLITNHKKQKAPIPDLGSYVEFNNLNQFSEKPKKKLNDEVGAPIQTKKRNVK